MAGTRGSKPRPVTCVVCGKGFTGYNSRAQYCSDNCNMKAWYERNREVAVARKRAERVAHPDRQKAADKKYYWNNRDRKLASSAEWRSANPDTVRVNNRAWKVANPGRRAELDRQRVDRNRGEVYAYQREYARAHPLLGQIRSARRRARLLGAEGSFTAAEWLAKLAAQGGACVYCGKSAKLTIDHDIPLIRGGSNWISNLVGACKPCNSSKCDRTGEEFRRARGLALPRPTRLKKPED